MPTYEALTNIFAGYGLTLRGGFHPDPEYEMLGNAATVILVGGDGLDMWGDITKIPFALPHNIGPLVKMSYR